MQFVLDVHCHTVSSGHAYSTINENAAWAKQIGLMLMGVADHGPAMPGSCGLFHFANIRVLPDYLEGVRLYKGAEANIVDYTGKLDIPDSILKCLDFVIASLHTVCVKPGSRMENTAAIVGAIENPNVNIIGHLGDPAYPFDMEKVVASAKRHHTAIEINNSSLKPGTHRYGGEETIRSLLSCCKEHSVPVIAGSDAHVDRDVGKLERAERLIVESGIGDEGVLNTDTQLFELFLKEEYHAAL